jgi:hypothetical protein
MPSNPPNSHDQNPQSNTQQFGPSLEAIHLLLINMQREIDELRGKSDSRRTSVSVSTPSICGTQPESSVVSLKVLQAIEKIPLPEGSSWQGSSDHRSAKRFLHEVSKIAALTGNGQ